MIRGRLIERTRCFNDGKMRSDYILQSFKIQILFDGKMSCRRDWLSKKIELLRHFGVYSQMNLT